LNGINYTNVRTICDDNNVYIVKMRDAKVPPDKEEERGNPP